MVDRPFRRKSSFRRTKPRKTTSFESRNLTMNIELFENRFAKQKDETELKLLKIDKGVKRGLNKCEIKEFYFEIE